MEEKFLNTKNFIVMCACCIIGTLLLGTGRLASLMFVACLTRYKTGRKQASLPFTLCYSVRNLSGPLVGYLSKVFDPENVTLFGCLLCAIGIGACFFAENIVVVTIFWGGVFGLSFGLGTILIPEIFLKYFEKHYDKAIGFYLAGECIGGFILSAVVELTLDTFGTSGTFLIVSGIILQCIPAAMILRNFALRLKMARTQAYRKATCIFSESDNDEERFNLNMRTNDQINDKNMIQNISVVDFKENRSDIDENPELLQQQEISKERKRNVEKSSIRKMHTSFGHFRVFLDPVFIFILLTQSSLVFSVTTILTVVIDYAREKGIASHQEIYLLMSFSIFDTLGRLTLGSITDAGWMTKIHFSSMCFMVLSFVATCLVWFEGFIVFIIVMCLGGLVFGGLIISGPGIVSYSVEKENVKMALASRYFLYPFLGFVQPSLIAYFRDTLGSYDGLFFLISGVNLAAALLVLLIPVTMKIKENRKETAETKFEKLLQQRKDRQITT